MSPRADRHLPAVDCTPPGAIGKGDHLKIRARAADGFLIRWALVIGAGIAGLLLGGAGVAAAGVVLAQLAARLSGFARP
jgi:hypothetical protein